MFISEREQTGENKFLALFDEIAQKYDVRQM